MFRRIRTWRKHTPGGKGLTISNLRITPQLALTSLHLGIQPIR